jgi:hypothetical protein
MADILLYDPMGIEIRISVKSHFSGSEGSLPQAKLHRSKWGYILGSQSTVPIRIHCQKIGKPRQAVQHSVINESDQ